MVSEVLAMGRDKWMVVDVLTYSLLRPGQVYPDSCDVRSGTGNNVGSAVPHVNLDMEGWGVNYRHRYIRNIAIECKQEALDCGAN